MSGREIGNRAAHGFDPSVITRPHERLMTCYLIVAYRRIQDIHLTNGLIQVPAQPPTLPAAEETVRSLRPAPGFLREPPHAIFIAMCRAAQAA